jgi:hypothetical protein
MQRNGVSAHTRNNWLIDAGLAASALVAMISGIYFLYLPVGGYRGGRNPLYGLVILFERHTWDDLHTWAGIAMIAIAAIHLTVHWSWVANITKRTWNELIGKSGHMNSHGRYNLVLNLVVGISFLLTGISGIYFLFFPGGQNTSAPLLVLSRTAWDLIHTWAGTTLILAALLHFAIHWKWVTKVTRSIFNGSSQSKDQTPRQPLDQPIS